MSKAAKREVRTAMTTEQLAKKAAKDVKQMSNVERAKLREQLDREFKKPRFRGMEGFAEAARRCAAEEAAMLNYDGKGKLVN